MEGISSPKMILYAPFRIIYFTELFRAQLLSLHTAVDFTAAHKICQYER